MVKNAKRICVAICFGSSNNLTGLLVSYFSSLCVLLIDPRPGRCVVSLSKRHLLPKSTGNTQE